MHSSDYRIDYFLRSARKVSDQSTSRIIDPTPDCLPDDVYIMLSTIGTRLSPGMFLPQQFLALSNWR